MSRRSRRSAKGAASVFVSSVMAGLLLVAPVAAAKGGGGGSRGVVILAGPSAVPVGGSGRGVDVGGAGDLGRGGGSGRSGGRGGGGGGGAATDLAPLSTLPVPRPTNSEIIDQTAAVRLGKALFWDVQVGGDGRIACATCHFNAGTDNRTLNTVNPGPDGRFQVVSGPGQVFHGGSFLADDVVGSQGIVGARFVGIASDPHRAADDCTPDRTAPFGANRRVTGRNAPSVIGAAYNRDNFWDGRARHTFNGMDPFGATANAGGAMGAMMENSSLASQAVGPANNPTEMSCAGRGFNGASGLGAKLLARTPLQFQMVSRTDSVLGALSAAPARGLTVTYRRMIEAAFGPTLAGVAERHFSRIWGEAVQAYEATLVPDQTPLDRYLAGNRAALTASQQKGLDIFQGKGGCTKCHAGAMMTDATAAFAAVRGLVNEDGGDQGYHNIGVRPTAEDLGRAGTGPGNVSFAETAALANRGAFKTPTLRNVKLTAPYFHDGSAATLAEVVAFYSRGGDFLNPELASRIDRIGLGASDQAALVDFLTNATLDCRVEKLRAPFDRPSLPLPNGPTLPAVGAAGTGPCP